MALGSLSAYGQEEESAEWSADEYTDRFQEVFFEALKQKGIENYDRAASLFLEARQIDPGNPVLDFELSRVLILEKKYPEAEDYALQALRARPGNYWFLQTFMEALEKQYKPLDTHRASLPFDLPEFRFNLARWYLDSGKPELAEAQMRGLPETPELLKLREQASRLKPEGEVSAPSDDRQGETESGQGRGSVANLEQELESLLKAGSWPSLEKMSEEALETYPLQPYFYYAYGIAKLRQDRPREALSILEEGESLLVGNPEVGRRIYAALAEAYTSLGDLEKARTYSNKLKAGS
jgi:predicted Zn-dependent protease